MWEIHRGWRNTILKVSVTKMYFSFIRHFIALGSLKQYIWQNFIIENGYWNAISDKEKSYTWFNHLVKTVVWIKWE